MEKVVSQERQRIHPHKFTLWVVIASITMMFAGLTSAYLVRSKQANWLRFEIPVTFYFSTLAILLSSLTLYLSVKAYKVREISKHKNLLLLTAFLGFLFLCLQAYGFYYLHSNGVLLVSEGSNPAGSFLGVIFGLHSIHLLGGIVALFIIAYRAFNINIRNYSTQPFDLLSSYWHFVDFLWIYLFLFFLLAR
jgi:cytochrome c oxidase subunit 3